MRLVDIDSEMLEFAQENIRERQLADRVDTVRADVEALPFQDNYAHLIVSRGSVFWENQVAGLNEVYRVLAPGGISFIGGGFATPELLEEVKQNAGKILTLDDTLPRGLALMHLINFGRSYARPEYQNRSPKLVMIPPICGLYLKNKTGHEMAEFLSLSDVMPT